MQALQHPQPAGKRALSSLASTDVQKAIFCSVVCRPRKTSAKITCNNRRRKKIYMLKLVKLSRIERGE